LKTTALKRIPIAILFAGFEGDLDTERKALLLSGHLNLALCYLKLQDHVESRDQCDKALKLDPSSEKGFFRRLVTKQKNVCLQEGEKILPLGYVFRISHFKVEVVGCHFYCLWPI
jgi:hypothetical protein